MRENPLTVVILILGAILLMIIAVKYRKRRLLKQGEAALREGRYLKAIDYLLKVDVVKAAKIIVESPKGTQALLSRHLKKSISDETRIKILERLAREYRDRSPHYASSAYLLAENVVKAAEVYIHAGFTKNAIEVIDSNPHLVKKKDETVRQLSKYAYEHGKYMEAVELLKSIGAQEEAAAVLTAASDILRRANRTDEVERLNLANAPDLNPRKAMDDYLRLATSYFQREDPRNARTTLAMVKHIIDYPPKEIDDLSSIKLEYSRLMQVMKRLETARDLLRQRRLDQARVHYAEILDIAGDLVPATVFAEAGLAYEIVDNELAADYYAQAAASSKSASARKKFLERAQALKSAPKGANVGLTSPAISIMNSLESERCIICKRKIKWDDDYIRCPECDSPAHYAHMAEWLKIKGACPVCQTKMHLDDKHGQN